MEDTEMNEVLDRFLASKQNMTQSDILAKRFSREQENVCPICLNSGWMEKEDEDGYTVCVDCSCGIRTKKILSGKLKFASIPDKFRDLRLYQFDFGIYREARSRKLIEVAFDCIRCWLDAIEEMNRLGMGLYLFSGTTGSGKTRMAASLANELIHEQGLGVKFATSLEIIDEIKKSWDKSYEMSESTLLDDLIKVQVLIIDDFGTEKMEKNKAWLDEKFYQIINGRYVAEKITIFTSNYSLDDLPYDDRIISRIKERVYQIPFPEESVREGLGKRNMEDLMERVGQYREKKAEQITMDTYMQE